MKKVLGIISIIIIIIGGLIIFNNTELNGGNCSLDLVMLKLFSVAMIGIPIWAWGYYGYLRLQEM